MPDLVEPLPEPLESFRVIEAGDARTYATSALLMRLGGPRERFYDYSAAAFLTTAPVPVVGEDGRQIGWASVSISGDKLIAAINIDFHCPERLLIEAGEKVWAHVHVVHEPSWEGRRDPTVVIAFEVWDVQLLLTRPKDETLPPVGTPIL